jgi:uncharacterized protein (DUF433 family)
MIVARARPMYTAAEVARWAQTSPKTARRWRAGYQFDSTSGKRWSPPVTAARGDEPYLSFEDLVEVAAVAAVRREGVSLQRLRAALDYATFELEIPRPLLSERFKTDGRDLFAQGGTNFNRFGQMVWPFVEAVLKDVDYGTDLLAIRWWPAGRDTEVLVDPQVNFGRPIIRSLGVRTETLVDRFVAGMSLEDVAEEYTTSPVLVQQAVRFENRSGAIAA